MSNCISHTGLFDDWENPLDDKGELFMPGLRLCQHSDCVNPTHLVSYARKNAEHNNRKYGPEVYEEIIRIGNMESGTAKVCLLSSCEEPRKARNLCAAHWSMFRHRQPKAIRRTNLMNLDDFPPLDPVLSPRERSHLGPRNCNVFDCPNKSRNRGLCPNHWQRYRTAYKRDKGKQWTSTQYA